MRIVLTKEMMCTSLDLSYLLYFISYLGSNRYLQIGLE